MRPRRVLSGLWLLPVLFLAAVAARAAPPPVPIRSGNHPGFGRLVFDFPSWVGWRMERHGEVVRLSFSRDFPFGPDPSLPHNVAALTDAPGQMEVTVVPGARLRRMRVGVRLVLDVLDPPRPREKARAPIVVLSRRVTPVRQTLVAAATRVRAGGQGAVPGTQPAVGAFAANRPGVGKPTRLAPAGPTPLTPVPVRPTRTGQIPTGQTSAGQTRAALTQAPAPAGPATLEPAPGRPASVGPASVGPTLAGPTLVGPAPAGPTRAGLLRAVAAPTGAAGSGRLARRPPASDDAASPRSVSADGMPQARPSAAPVPTGPTRAATAGDAKRPADRAAGPVDGVVGGSLAVTAAHHAGSSGGLATPPPNPTAVVPVLPAIPRAGPVALAAVPTAPTAGLRATAILVPFEASVGAASFRRAGQGIIVFDTPRPIDLAALRGNPVFGTASVHLLADGTELILKLPPGAAIRLRRRPAGWEVAVGHAAAAGGTIRPQVHDGQVLLAVTHPGRVVSLLDPESGAPLLVGTELGVGAGLAVTRRAPQFALLASWRGVVAEALSDRLTLHTTPTGFALAEAGGRLAVTAASAATMALADAANLTRRFHFAALPTAALARRLRHEMASAARRPPLGRGPSLRRAARSMIALGMGVEAGALLRLAAAEDPREALVPAHVGLAAVAALLAGHPHHAGGIDDQRLSGSDEVALWRAVRAAELHHGAPRAAQLFAAVSPLILTYPRALRRRLLPLAAETMISGGALGPAAQLLARRPHDPRLALARGMLDAARGRSAEALAIYDRLARGADRLVRIRAATRAVALRLATKRIGPAAAADALVRLLDAWRGGTRELALRQTLAGLWAEAGQWRRALAMLRATIVDFPDAGPALRARMRGIFTAMLADPRFDRMPPLQFVALLDANADLLPTGRAGEPVEAKLADRLLALDLPDQAAPVLAKLMHAAPTPAGRAGFGARLAALRLAENDPAGALKALTSSAADGLPAELGGRRAVLVARVQAAQGHVAEALAALRAISTVAADRAAATIAERAGDWPGAEQALHAFVIHALPAEGRLDPAQCQVLLRLATATVRAGDAAGVAALRADQGRMGSGPLADMFRLLTGPAVHSVADLPRVGAEAALADRFANALKAIR